MQVTVQLNILPNATFSNVQLLFRWVAGLVINYRNKPLDSKKYEKEIPNQMFMVVWLHNKGQNETSKE